MLYTWPAMCIAPVMKELWRLMIKCDDDDLSTWWCLMKVSLSIELAGSQAGMTVLSHTTTVAVFDRTGAQGCWLSRHHMTSLSGSASHFERWLASNAQCCCAVDGWHWVRPTSGSAPNWTAVFIQRLNNKVTKCQPCDAVYPLSAVALPAFLPVVLNRIMEISHS